MASRSMSSSERSAGAKGRVPPFAPIPENPRESATAPPENTSARSIEFFSSRTLPGQRIAGQHFVAPARKAPRPRGHARARRAPAALRPAAECPRDARASAGTGIVSTLRRKYKSSRNCPSETRRARSALVRAIRRASIVIVSVPPRRSNCRSSSTRKQLRLRGRGKRRDFVQHDGSGAGHFQAAQLCARPRR